MYGNFFMRCLTISTGFLVLGVPSVIAFVIAVVLDKHRLVTVFLCTSLTLGLLGGLSWVAAWVEAMRSVF